MLVILFSLLNFRMVSFVCNHEKCQKEPPTTFKSVESLHQHLTRSHLLIQCNQCENGLFYTRENLKTHAKKIHRGLLVCKFCHRPFGTKQRLLRRHYKFCSKESKQKLYVGQKSRQDLDTCFSEFYKKKEEQHSTTKANNDKKLRVTAIPKKKIPVPIPIKFRNRSINHKPTVLKFFDPCYD